MGNKSKRERQNRGGPIAGGKRKWRFSLEREKLLSRNTGDSTVGSLRDKKENCSTRRGLCVGIRFTEFPQTPRGRGFSLLGFYSLFKYFTNV